jgi:hypothetical protein
MTSARFERHPVLLASSLLPMLALALPLAAGAQHVDPGRSGEPSDFNERWTPWLSLGFDIAAQDVDAGLASDSVPNLGGGTSSLLVDENAAITPAGFSAQVALVAPRLLDSFGEPRPFVHAGGTLPGKTSHLIEGLLTNEEEVELRFRTIGSWYAGVGLEFTLPALDRRLRLKPSIDYFGQRVDYEGRITHSDLIDPDRAPVPNNLSLRMLADGDDSDILHGVGPRLALDALIGRYGPIGFSLYGQIQAFWLLGDLEKRFVGPNRAPDPDNPGQTLPGEVEFFFEPNDIVFQGGAGFRLTWLGDWRSPRGARAAD